MNKPLLKTLLGAGCVSLAVVGTASAGGLERGGYNIDLLFDPARFASEASVTYVMPQRKLKNVVDTDTTTAFPPPATGPGGGNLNSRPDSADDTESYWIPRVGIKAGIGDHVDCMADYSQPWGAHTNPGLNWAGANSNIETKIESDNYAATCSYKFDAGKGQLRFIGGVFYQEVSGFKERLVQDFSPFPFVPLTGVGRIDLEGDGVGWRIGAAYEIPEIAFRASLVYNSDVDLGDITGNVDLRQVDPARGVIPVIGTAKMPDSVEFKVQSGIAPNWLAFGSIKWVDWSQLQFVDFCATVAPDCVHGVPASGFVTSFDLLYQDGWTVSAGVGHKFTDALSGAVSIAWDRGTSTGVGTLTDTWTVSAGGSYIPNQNTEFRLGGALGVLTSGSTGAVTRGGIVAGNDYSADFGNDLVAAISASAKIKW